MSKVKQKDNTFTRKVKLPNGTTRKVLYVRVRYTDATGKRRSIAKRIQSKTEGRTVVQKLLARASRTAKRAPEDHPRRTFAELAQYYKAEYAKPAEYVGGRKVAGCRSYRTKLSDLAQLTAAFGGRRLEHISYEDIRRYKSARLNEPIITERKIQKKQKDGTIVEGSVKTKRARSITSVHRALQLLRHMLNVAVRHHWLDKNPFGNGEALISKADERPRNRILTFDEEKLLLAKCTGRRSHLRAVLLCLVDTAMRSGECFKLKLKDVAFDPREFSIEASNTKTLTARSAPISKRLALELAHSFAVRDYNPEAYLFAFDEPWDKPLNNVKRSFKSACEAAGIKDLRMKDLRRTAATRLVRAGMPIGEIARVLGHSDIKTTYQYVAIDTDTISRAGEIMDQLAAEFLSSSDTEKGDEPIEKSH